MKETLSPPVLITFLLLALVTRSKVSLEMVRGDKIVMEGYGLGSYEAG